MVHIINMGENDSSLRSKSGHPSNPTSKESFPRIRRTAVEEYLVKWAVFSLYYLEKK